MTKKAQKVTVFAESADLESFICLYGQTTSDGQKVVGIKVRNPRIGRFDQNNRSYVVLYADQGEADETTWALVIFTPSWAALCTGVKVEDAPNLKNWPAMAQFTITY